MHNPFWPVLPFNTPEKHQTTSIPPENIREPEAVMLSSGVFRGCKIRALTRNGLIFNHRIVVRVSITEIKLIGYAVDLFVPPFLVYLAFFLI